MKNSWLRNMGTITLIIGLIVAVLGGAYCIRINWYKSRESIISLSDMEKCLQASITVINTQKLYNKALADLTHQQNKQILEASLLKPLKLPIDSDQSSESEQSGNNASDSAHVDAAQSIVSSSETNKSDASVQYLSIPDTLSERLRNCLEKSTPTQES